MKLSVWDNRSLGQSHKSDPGIQPLVGAWRRAHKRTKGEHQKLNTLPDNQLISATFSHISVLNMQKSQSTWYKFYMQTPGDAYFLILLLIIIKIDVHTRKGK